MLKENIIRCFNAGAKTYHASADIQLIAAKKLVDSLPEFPVHTILEIGCGTGILSEFLLKKFPQATILLTDIAPEMIKITRQRFANHANVQVVCMDGEQLSLSSTYDLIISGTTLHWFTQLSSSLQNFIEKLTPTGCLAFSLLGTDTLQEWKELCATKNIIPGTPVFPSLTQLKAQFPEIGFLVENCNQAYPDVFTFLRTLKKIGATATTSGYLPLTVGQLRNILRANTSQFNINYEIIYGQYKKR